MDKIRKNGEKQQEVRGWMRIRSFLFSNEIPGDFLFFCADGWEGDCPKPLDGRETLPETDFMLRPEPLETE